jgi:multidrug efflux system outer membrane protein
MKRYILALLPLLVLTSCAVGPNYKRPAVVAPPQFHNGPGNAEPGPNSIADIKSFDLFKDDALTELLKAALVHNHDVNIAAERVLESQAQYGATRASLFPAVNALGQFNSNRSSSVGSYTFIPKGTDLSSSYTQAGFALSWEIDLWGRLRRLNESARAQYLATEEARRSVLSSVVADVAGNYLTLVELDQELETAKATRDIAESSLKLTNLRHQRGVATSLDVHQAEQLLYTATAQISATERMISETEDQISFLIGSNPGSIRRGKKLGELVDLPEIPLGLPSALLERRPDIRQAEYTLVSANAQIGAARALYFPQISLTGFLGGQSRSLSNLFTGPARQFVLAPAGDLPIFDAGRIRSGVKFAEASKREMVISYQKAIQNAFREVSDALVDHEKTREQRKQEELFVAALRDSAKLSRMRYKGGLDSYLQVLYADRNLFDGELNLARLRRDELVSIVHLYRALGGGWN